MGLALKEFVDKDEKEAIGEIVKLQLRDTQKILSEKKFRDEDIISEVVKETERSRAEQPSQEEEARTRKVCLHHVLLHSPAHPLPLPRAQITTKVKRDEYACLMFLISLIICNFRYVRPQL